MIASLSPWLLLLIGISSIFIVHPWERGVYVTAVLLIGPLLEWLLPLDNSRRIGGLTGVTLALLTPVPLIDRLALIVAVATCQAFPYSAHRPMVASVGLMVAAGPNSHNLAYDGLSALYTFILGFWLYDRRHGKNSQKPKIWLSFLYLTAIFIVGAATTALLPQAHRWMVERAVGPTFLKRAGFGVVTNLRGITSIQRSSAITLRMWSKGPRLLRGQVYSTYGNGLWSASGSAPFTFIAEYDDEEFIAKGKDIEYVERTSRSSRFVFMPRKSQPKVVRGCRIERNRHGTLFSTTNAVVSYAYTLRPNPMESAGVWQSTTPGEYLGIPQHLKPVLTKIAKANWWGSTKKEKIQSLASFLNGKYRYSLSPHTPKYGYDPILWFLQERREGHCELFASAMVLLARSIDIPARYVSGYSVSTRNPFTDYYIGRDCDAHAWCEVWLEKEGWVDVDPTPPDWRGAQTNGTILFIRNLADGISFALTRQLNLFYDRMATLDNEAFANQKTFIGLFLILPLCFYIFWRHNKWFFDKWTSWVRAKSNGQKLEEVQLSFSQFEKLFHSLGVKRQTWETAEEFLQSIDKSVADERTRELAREFVTLFSLTRYGKEPWPKDRVKNLVESLQRAMETHSR